MQTSVEWLWEQIRFVFTGKKSAFEVFEQAKEMHKAERETLYTEEQVKEAYISGHSLCRCVTDNHQEALESADKYIQSLKQPKKD